MKSSRVMSWRAAFCCFVFLTAALQAESQTIASRPGFTAELNWRVTFARNDFRIDPGLALTLHNRLRLGPVTTFGYFPLASKTALLYDLGARASFDRLSASVRYGRTPIGLPYVEMGQTEARGGVASLSYAASPSVSIGTRWFYGKVATAGYSGADGYYGEVTAHAITSFNYRNSVEYLLTFSLPGSVSDNERTFGVDFSVPFRLLGNRLDITPRLGYLQRPPAGTKDYLADLAYDFSAFTLGPLTSSTTGNALAAITASWHIYPFRTLEIPIIDRLYIGPVGDGGLFWGADTPLASPKAAMMAGGAVGVDLFGVHVEFRAGYRSDVTSPFVWDVMVY